MKKTLLIIISLIALFMIIQTIRYNYGSKNVKEFEFYTIDGKKTKLKEYFNDNDNKLIVYILPECDSCIHEINELNRINKQDNFQVILISAGLKNFDYYSFYKSHIINKKTTFLIDKKNTFYRDFGLGFTEEFPTLIEYSLSKNSYNKIDFYKSILK